MRYGAVIERGRVTGASGARYIVASLDRDGIVSPAIPGTDGTEYEIGDMVYFFLFRDGTGKILCKA